MQHTKANPFDRPQQIVTLRACARRVLGRTAAALAFAFVCLTAFAAPGDLDPTFGVGGIRTINVATVPGSNDLAGAMVRQNDGKLLVAGGNGQDSVIIRLDIAGNLDPTWGVGGKTIGISGRPLALDAGGNVYVITGQSGSQVKVVKLDTNGNLVPSFGTGGMKPIDGGAGPVALDASGNIYIASVGGDFSPTGVPRDFFAVTKLDVNGNPVPGFGIGGKGTTAAGYAAAAAVAALALDATGNIYIAGTIATPGSGLYDFAVAKFDANGNLVSSFGVGGMRTIDFGSIYDTAVGLALDADGSVYIGGYSYTGGGNAFALAKLDASGNLVPSFAGGGTRIIGGFGGDAAASALALDASGNIYMAGGRGIGGGDTTSDFALVKLDTNGNLVPGFGTGGVLLIDIGNRSKDGASALVLDASGNVYVAGNSDSAGSNDFAVVKLDANGNLVPGFGTGGKQTIDIGTKSLDYANALALDASGNAYLAGASGRLNSADFSVVKLDANGNLVTGFGSGGKRLIDIGNNSDDVASALALDASGNIYLAGTTGARDFAVAKVDPNGNLVAGFGVGGKQTIRFSAVGSDVALALAVDANGNIYVAGYSTASGSSRDFAVAKLDANGNLVAGFGAGGKRLIDIGSNSFDVASALALDASGNVYLAGNSSNDFAVVKLDANGNLVPGFGAGGKRLIDIGSNSFDVANALALDASGNVYVAGSSYGPANIDFAIVKLDPNGNLVPSFGAGGKKTIDMGNSSAVAQGLALDARGNVYVAGTRGTNVSSLNTDFAVVKLDGNGNLVTSFGAGGKKTVDINAGSNDAAYALALDASGRVVVAGSTTATTGNADSDFAVIRLQGDQPPPPIAAASPVFRFFNTAAGTHFYTISTAERDSIQSTLAQYHYEGPAFSAYTSQVNGTSPVYRFFNTATGTHFYTISEAEKNNVVANLPSFHLEGTAYYAYATQVTGTSAVYRFFDTGSGTHFYTISTAERDNVLNTVPQYHYDGTAYYAVP